MKSSVQSIKPAEHWQHDHRTDAHQGPVVQNHLVNISGLIWLIAF